MPSKKLNLRVITPEAVKVEMETDMVIMRCITGDMGILADHEACSAVLDYGVLRILDEDDERRMAVYGGIAQVSENLVTVLANSAQWPGEIDHDKAEVARDDAMRRLKDEDTESVDVTRDQVLLRRSLVQLEVSSYPVLNKHTGK